MRKTIQLTGISMFMIMIMIMIMNTIIITIAHVGRQPSHSLRTHNETSNDCKPTGYQSQ
jgi:hypothetical protein